MSSIRSASGARQGGDDFQHLVAWNRILRSLPEQRGLVSVEVEAIGAGNVDDVVIRSSTVPHEFTQVRYGVDLTTPIDIDYLLTSKETGTSLLTKFHRSWHDLGGATDRPRLQLVTNKLADPTDTLLRSVDGRLSTVSPALRAASPGSALGRVRAQLADHLTIGEDELLTFLDDLRFRLGCHFPNEAEGAASLMLASGMDHRDSAVRVGIDLVRQWVLDGRRLLTADEVREHIAAAGVIADAPWATLMIQAIDHDPLAADSDVALDFVDNYDGDTPATRRAVHPGAYAAMHGEIAAAGERLSAAGQQRVMVSGPMRLATWFAAGAALPEVAGHTVRCGRASQPWASDEQATPLDLDVRRLTMGDGPILGVALAFSADPTADVEAFIRGAGIPVKSLVTIGAPDTARVRDQEEANGYAVAIKLRVRQELREQRCEEVHLFMAAPAGLALLLGHTWNRVAPTVVWEDLGIRGYELAYRFGG